MRIVLDVATGSVVQRLDYDPWGNASVTGNGFGGISAVRFQPFGFAGGIWRVSENLWLLGARDYDPTTGRWTTKDPSLFRGGLNLYAYCENDPVNRIDPTGREWVELPESPDDLDYDWQELQDVPASQTHGGQRVFEHTPSGTRVSWSDGSGHFGDWEGRPHWHVLNPQEEGLTPDQHLEPPAHIWVNDPYPFTGCSRVDRVTTDTRRGSTRGSWRDRLHA